MRVAVARALQSRLVFQIPGYSLVILGLILLAAYGSYWIFEQVSKAGLKDDNVSVPLQALDFPNAFASIDTTDLEAAGAFLHSDDGSQWRVPTPAEYRMVDWATLPRTSGALPDATRMIIPALDINTPIVELGTVWENGTLVWERPVNAVGHHQGTPNPGELGNVVMSGHRSSLILDEGAVFRRLGEVPEILRDSETSDDVLDIFLYGPDYIYVYRTASSQVVEPAEVSIFGFTAEPTLTLITCTPDLIYSHRLIVTAWLVAQVPV